MTSARRAPWDPDRRWADPLIALLALLALLAAGLTLRVRQGAAHRPAARVSLQGQMMEVTLAGPRLLRPAAPPHPAWARLEDQAKEPWDRALLAVLVAELEDLPAAHRLLAAGAPEGPEGHCFRATFAAAYDQGPLPEAAVRDEVRRRLGRGYAAALLEARCLDREGRAPDAEALRAQARRALITRLAALGGLGLLVTALAAGGLVLGIYLWVTRRQPPLRPLPVWEMSGRAAILVFLGWFLAFFAAGNLAGLLLSPWPALRWAAVPLGTLLHAAFGIRFIGWAEGLTFRELWRRVAPGPATRNLGWGAAFLALAVLLVITVSLASNLALKPDQSPQRDLQELLRTLPGRGSVVLMFAVVAGLAPCFEEFLFRGFLLPVLASRGRVLGALLASALLFGAIHLQPAGLPTLGTLGFVMGLAVWRTGSLWPAILVHACWNGSIYLLMRAFA